MTAGASSMGNPCPTECSVKSREEEREKEGEEEEEEEFNPLFMTALPKGAKAKENVIALSSFVESETESTESQGEEEGKDDEKMSPATDSSALPGGQARSSTSSSRKVNNHRSERMRRKDRAIPYPEKGRSPSGKLSQSLESKQASKEAQILMSLWGI